MAETAGVIITKYLTQIPSAISPIKGLNSDGILRITFSRPAMESEIPGLEIRSGNMGAKKEV